MKKSGNIKTVKKNNAKIAAVIACRVNSTRLFGKPLQLVGKYPILHLLLNQLKKSSLISEIVLAISENPGNEIFVSFAQKYKLKYILGKEDDVLKRLIIGAKYVNADIVFHKTSEDPYIYWEGIDSIIEKHIQGNFDYTYLEDVPLGAGYEVINLKLLEIAHKFGIKKSLSDPWPRYIYENRNKYRIHRFMPEKVLRRPELRLTVDTPQDLWVVRLVYEALGSYDKPISLKRIIKFLDNSPQITKINSNISVGESRIWV